MGFNGGFVDLGLHLVRSLPSWWYSAKSPKYNRHKLPHVAKSQHGFRLQEMNRYLRSYRVSGALLKAALKRIGGDDLVAVGEDEFDFR